MDEKAVLCIAHSNQQREHSFKKKLGNKTKIEANSK